MARKPKPSLVEIVNPPKKTSNRYFGSVSQVNIGNFPAPPYAVTIPVPTPVTDNAGSLTVDQATRTNLKVQPEREDLLVINADLATNVNPQAVLAAVAGQYHKVYGWDYACDAAGTFEFQITKGGVTRKFARRKTAGVHAMTLVHPIVCDVNTALNFLSNGGNTYYSLRYITEA